MSFLRSYVAALLVLAPVLAGATQKIVLKVNLAGDAVGDFLGESQVFDLEEDGYSKSYSKTPVQGTDQPEVFQKQRFSRDEDFMLRIPVPDGIYAVTLLMAETYDKACTPNARVFDIFIGTPVSGLTLAEPNFDLFANAGCNSAYGKRFENVVSKNGIVIHLGHKKQHPALAGFIAEGFPVPKGDGSEYKAIAQIPPEELEGAGGDNSANSLAGGVSPKSHALGQLGMSGAGMQGDVANVGSTGGQTSFGASSVGGTPGAGAHDAGAQSVGFSGLPNSGSSELDSRLSSGAGAVGGGETMGLQYPGSGGSMGGAFDGSDPQRQSALTGRQLMTGAVQPSMRMMYGPPGGQGGFQNQHPSHFPTAPKSFMNR